MGETVANSTGVRIVPVTGRLRRMTTSPRPRPRRHALGLPAAAFATLALVASGCGDDDAGSAGDGGEDAAITVVATTTQLADFARQVGGERVDVVQLLQPNTDPHDYEPRPQDIQRAAEAEVMLVSGDELDEWAGDVAEQAGLADSAIVDAGAARPVTLEGGHHHDDEGDDHSDEGDDDEHAEDEKDGDDHAGEEDVDPHWWHDPRNARAAVTAIRDAFVTADADGAATYRANAASYAKEIDALDAQLASCFQSVPEEQRKLVSDHDAFAYLTERYDIEFVGAIIPSTTSQAQPSAGAISDLVTAVKRETVGAIFPESSLNPALAKTIAERTGARVGGALYADTLGPQDGPGGTYLGSMRENARALVEGFTDGAATCGAPEDPGA